MKEMSIRIIVEMLSRHLMNGPSYKNLWYEIYIITEKPGWNEFWNPEIQKWV